MDWERAVNRPSPRDRHVGCIDGPETRGIYFWWRSSHEYVHNRPIVVVVVVADPDDDDDYHYDSVVDGSYCGNWNIPPPVRRGFRNRPNHCNGLN